MTASSSLASKQELHTCASRSSKSEASKSSEIRSVENAQSLQGSIGSSFDDFLQEEGLLEVVVASATERLVRRKP